MIANKFFQLIAISMFLTFFSSYQIMAGEKSLKVYEGTFENALKYAVEQGKPLIVKTYTEWCGWCKRMDANTLSDEEVIGFLNDNFVTVKIDAEKGEGPAFSETYDAKRFPTIIFFDQKGEEVHRFRGYKNASGFLKEAGEALAKLNEQ